MTDVVWSAMIGVGGAVLVAIAGAVTQVLVTRSVIRAERLRVAEQIRGESTARAREARDEHLRDAVAELLAIAEPAMFDLTRYFKLLPLIHRVQLQLDLDAELERRVMGAVNELAFAAEKYERIPRSARPTDEMKQRLLETHAQVGEATRQLLTQRLKCA